MAIKVTPEVVRKINQRYYECHNKAQVARELGCSAGTVSKYIDANYTPAAEPLFRFTLDMLPPVDTSVFEGKDDYSPLCYLSDDEKAEIVELWKEIS